MFFAEISSSVQHRSVICVLLRRSTCCYYRNIHPNICYCVEALNTWGVPQQDIYSAVRWQPDDGSALEAQGLYDA